MYKFYFSANNDVLKKLPSGKRFSFKLDFAASAKFSICTAKNQQMKINVQLQKKSVFIWCRCISINLNEIQDL